MYEEEAAAAVAAARVSEKLSLKIRFEKVQKR
jgi:hypothetical protein